MQKIVKLFILIFSPFFLNAQSDCQVSTSYAELDFNNIKAGLLQSGSLWWNSMNGKYIANSEPGEPDVTAIFAGGLWFGGEHPDGSVRVAASTYGQGGSNRTDYFPGPINATTGTVSTEDCTNWDKHFKILKLNINSHINDFSADNEIDFQDSTIYSWPGKDNPHFFDFNGFTLPEGQDLAPFVDVNSDNIYNPSDGDYPDIKGDQAIWWVFNDIGNIHTQTNGAPINIEVHTMAYAYQSFESTIDNTTFYDFKMKYYGEETLENFQAALWMDVDLGCYTDDYIGIDTLKNMAYYYNVDIVDGDVFDQCPGGIATYGTEIPMLGVKLMDDSEDLGVTSFNYMVNTLGSPPGAESAPAAPNEYFYYMSGFWRDGTPMYNTGNGYGASEGVTKFAFHGNPSIESEWSMCSAASQNNPEYDRTTVLSSGGTSLNPGDIREWTYAVIFVPNVPHPCPDLIDICAAADVVENFTGMISSVSMEKTENELFVKISPNPTQNQFNISVPLTGTPINKIEIRDVSGKLLRQKNVIDAYSHTVSRNGLANGIYFIKIITKEGRRGVEKIIFQ